MTPLWTFAKAIGRVIARLWRSEPVIVSAPVATDRRYRCENGCPHYKHGLCGICKCAVAAKVWLRTESCPDNPPRWKRL